MVAHTLSLSQISPEQMHYQPYPDAMVKESPTLRLSIEQAGILSPVIVHQIAGQYHLIDGFKRLNIAREKQFSELSCEILPEETHPLHIVTLILQKDEASLQHSAARKSLFLALCHKLAIKNQDLAPLLALLHIENHSRVIRQYLNVAELPHEVLTFCDEKGFSLKQCTHLSKHPRPLLTQLFRWRNQLHFTAAVIEEILDHFKNIFRIEGIDLQHIEQEKEFIAIMNSQSNNQQRTQALRNWLHLRRYPRLSAIQSKMDRTVGNMQLNKSVSLSWDRNLEIRALTITARFNEPEQWPGICQSLASSPMQEGIDALMEEL